SKQSKQSKQFNKFNNKQSTKSNNKQSNKANNSNKQSNTVYNYIDHRTYKQFTDKCLVGDLQTIKTLLLENKNLIVYQPCQQLFDLICQYGQKIIAEYIYNFVL